MKKQKNMFFLFGLSTVAVFVFSLYFMTDYQDLFGLFGVRYEANKLVADFHDNLMQSANQTFFKFAIFGILTAVFALAMEIRHKVADKFALIVLCVLFAVLVGVAIYNIITLSGLLDAYTNLDTSFVDDEGGSEHIRKYTAFYVGFAVYGINAIATVLMGVILTKNHFDFIKLAKKAEGGVLA